MLFAAESRLNIIGCWFQLAVVETWPHCMFILEDEIFMDSDRCNVKVAVTKEIPVGSTGFYPYFVCFVGYRPFHQKEVLLLQVTFLWPVPLILSFFPRQL